mmetsp:Transcript_55543/g.102760  ORF Transcript_55543/g.102760 Transcript_55543/m.102760 type:complete len:324 (+) Transcript_55543:47-1018(+)
MRGCRTSSTLTLTRGPSTVSNGSIARKCKEERSPTLKKVCCHKCGSMLRADLKSTCPRGSVGTRCPSCQRRVCAHCGRTWSRLHSCELAADMAGELDKRLASLEFDSFAGALGLKRCPACGSGCEKADQDSCDHMTCLNCRHEFCWTCLADRTVILHHGNHYHKPDCRFNFGPGPTEWQPKCPLCVRNGVACQPPTSDPPAATASLVRRKSASLLSRANKWSDPQTQASVSSLRPAGFTSTCPSPPSPFLDSDTPVDNHVSSGRFAQVDMDASHVERKLCSCQYVCPGQEMVAKVCRGFFKPWPSASTNSLRRSSSISTLLSV